MKSKVQSEKITHGKTFLFPEELLPNISMDAVTSSITSSVGTSSPLGRKVPVHEDVVLTKNYRF